MAEPTTEPAQVSSILAGRYEIGEPIGEGGRSVVHAAQ